MGFFWEDKFVKLKFFAVAAALTGGVGSAFAFGIFGNQGLAGGFRWDAAPRTVNGWERSLDGGLRYSLQGRTYQAYRDSFTWQGTAPSVSAFQTAIENAFNEWRAIDPVTGFGTKVNFAYDGATAVSTTVLNGVREGAEIDLFAFAFGDASFRADAFFNAVGANGNMTLTSGTTGYDGGAISGADIRMNNTAGTFWTLDWFQTILTHEIGHALGLADVDLTSGPNGTFIDDNYDGTNNTTAAATLTNSFSGLINIHNPAASPLNMYSVLNGQPGFDSPGANILMESQISNFFLNNAHLTNDDFAGRQFLYPVPEPSMLAVLGLGFGALLRRRRKASV